MSKMKKIIMVALIVLVSCALVSMTATVKATDQNPIIDISGNLDISTGNETSSNTTSNNNVAPSINTTENSQVIQPVTNTTENTTENTTNKLPQTGVTEDITVMFFIVVCAVSAIYAYKKIRDYNM